jgi:CHAT domain-containing protein
MFSKCLFSIFFLSTIIACQTSAFAANPYAECNDIAIKLLLDINLCRGQANPNYKIKLKQINDTDNLSRLGIELRRLGYLDDALNILERSLEIMPTSVETHLSIANVTHAQYRRSYNLIDFSEESVPNLDESDRTLALANQALSEYLEIINNSSSRTPKLEASLNWLSLWSSLKNIKELNELQNQNLSISRRIISEVSPELSNASRDDISSKLRFAEFLIRVVHLDKSFQALAQDNVKESLKESYQINDSRLISKAEGLTAKLDLLAGDEDSATKSFLIAYREAESIQAHDLSYQWAWEVARILIKKNDYKKGLEFYSAAVNRAESVRSRMLSLKTDIQYSFRDEIEPLYKEFLALLFRDPKANLEKIIKTNENLQIGELENYLRCSRLELENLLTSTSTQRPESALYFIKLPHLYATIVRDNSGHLFYHFIDKQKLDILLFRFQKYNQGEDFFASTNSNQFRQVFTELYSLLIKPIEKTLPKEGGQLTLAIDSSLQSLPWGCLYDGHNYLIEKYSLSLAIGSKVQTSKPFNKNHVSGLIAGSSKFPNNPEYAEIPSVPAEIRAVNSKLKGKSLINNQFTTQALLNNAENVNILHLASHGQFSSNPEETFLLNSSGKFQLGQLETLLRNRQTNPLDLLVLSACDTAKGDRRALLGLAGTAIQSGARSVVASLWLVNDQSQVILMQEFYTELLTYKKSKADALRLAQLKLLKSNQYSSPYYWAGIILLGS